MAQIVIDFLQGVDRLSQLISWFGQGPGGYSHAASVLKDGRYLDARDDRIGSVPAGVHIRDPAKEKWAKKVRASLEVTDAEYESWESSLRAKITDGYARGDILSFIFNRDLHVNGTYDCSELAINAVQHVSRSWQPGHLGYVPFPLPVPANRITPNAALLIVATAGFTIGAVEVAP